jgi:hypothetical protein
MVIQIARKSEISIHLHSSAERSKVKSQTSTLQFPIEVNGVPGLILSISVSARREMLAALEAVGVETQELPNLIKKLVEDARDACDGSVPGLIVTNLEE